MLIEEKIKIDQRFFDYRNNNRLFKILFAIL
jgi:hypothetical protein